MIIGKFVQQDDSYNGSIFGLGFAGRDVTFSPVPAKLGNGPDFVVLTTPWEGDAGEFELGAAWRKTSRKDKPYLSVKLDSPALVAPINCALTKQPDGSHALVWNRKEAEADVQPADQARAE